MTDDWMRSHERAEADAAVREELGPEGLAALEYWLDSICDGCGQSKPSHHADCPWRDEEPVPLDRARYAALGYSEAEMDAIERNEAGLYFLTDEDRERWHATEELPVPPEANMIVHDGVYSLNGRLFVRWYVR